MAETHILGSLFLADASSPKRWIFKVILMGDYAVGKTCIIRRYVSNTFIEDYKASIGVDITSQELNYEADLVQLQLWDMSGQTDFKLVRKQFMSGTDIGVIVFDLTRPSSLQSVGRWINEIHAMVPELPLVLVGNKSDLEKERQVSQKDAEKTVKEHGMLFYAETSAKSGTNITQLFGDVAHRLMTEMK
jgi:small GTP-binding protein